MITQKVFSFQMLKNAIKSSKIVSLEWRGKVKIAILYVPQKWSAPTLTCPLNGEKICGKP